MTAIPAEPLEAAALYVVPALLWAVLCERTWYFSRTRRPHSWFFRMLPLVSGLMAFHLTLNALGCLVPREIYAIRPGWLIVVLVLNDLSIIATLALFRHLVRFVPGGGGRPTPAWLAANYAAAMVVATLCLFVPSLIPGETLDRKLFVYVTFLQVYTVGMFGLIAAQAIRVARRGLWRPGGVHELRRPDVVILVVGALMIASFLVRLVAGGQMPEPSLRSAGVDAAAHVAVALPLVVRLFGEVVRGFLLAGITIIATGTVYLAAQAVTSHLDPRLQGIVDVLAIAMLALVVLPGQAWLRGVIDRLVFRRTRLRQAKLLAVLHELPPELGALECCRRALAEFSRIMNLRGAAVLLVGEPEPVVHGAFDAEPVCAVWPEEAAAADALFPHGFGVLEVIELPPRVQSGLQSVDVVGVFPIVSPRRRWGHVFMTTGLLRTNITDEDVDVIRPFGDQLALVLDSAELLARAVTVERSLAHAEKLAAIGETAARIAHDIRNPVTAARSLAQQLAREPGSRFQAEHDLILAELERVEHQVAALLRFARREEFRLAPVELDAIVGTTVEAFRARCEAGGIVVDVRLAPVTARADAEKLRHVLVNLIENALDALANGAAVKRLGVTLTQVDGRATIEIADSGPGVPADALPRLFEPFFSLKEHGTGLGLAIARRTIDAHGGRIAARLGDAGTVFRIDLPLGGLA